jgi:hypothetical protein
MDKDYYRAKMLEQLRDDNTYKQISKNMDRTIINKIKKFSEIYKCTLSKDEIEYITDFNYVTSNFYGLPKIHKSMEIKNAIGLIKQSVISIENPVDLKFRPIVAGPSCPTHRLSHMLDVILQPYIKYVNANVVDSVDLLNKLPQTLSDSEFFVTLDVKSLYSNIDHKMGLEAIAYWLDKFPDDTGKYSSSFILDGCRLILENNTFEFDGINYMQTQGTAMGTKFAPAYATLTLGYLEEIVFEDISTTLCARMSGLIKNNYFRYLDDVLCIWDRNWGDPSLLQNSLNKVNSNIEFICDQKGDTVSFLDIKLIKNCSNCLETDIFYKETDSKQYLDYKSNHPRYIKNNIPYNLSRRICTIVSNRDTRAKRLLELAGYLGECSYPHVIVYKGIKSALSIPVTELRTRSQKKKNDGNNIPFITTYNPNYEDNSRVVGEVFGLLQGADKTKRVFKDRNILRSKRQPPNLKRLLTNSKLDKPLCGTVSKCEDSRCSLCHSIIEGSKFDFLNCGKTFVVKENMNCNTKFCIYAMKCGCGKTYIGETKDFRSRTTLHRQHIKENAQFEVSKHIFHCNGGKFRIMPIYKMRNDDERERKNKESYFIKIFKPELNRKE